MIFAILYIIFFRVNDYYTVTIYNNDMINSIMYYGKKNNIFITNSNHIEYDNMDRIFQFWKKYVNNYTSYLSVSGMGYLLKYYGKPQYYGKYKYHKLACPIPFYDSNFNIRGEITYNQHLIKSLVFKFHKKQNIIFNKYYKYISRSIYEQDKVKHFHLFNYDTCSSYFNFNMSSQLKYTKKLQLNPYLPSSIYAVKDMRYLAHISISMSKHLVIVGLNNIFTMSACKNDNQIIVIDNLEINDLFIILDILRHTENRLSFVIVNNESDLDKYGIRNYVNLQLLNYPKN
jgi:hypothetical protein